MTAAGDRSRRFTLMDLRASDRALRAYERGRITASRLCECITSAMRGEWYDIGDAETLPDRIEAAFLYRGPMTAAEVAAFLGADVAHVSEALSRGRRRFRPVGRVANGVRQPNRWDVGSRSGGGS